MNNFVINLKQFVTCVLLICAYTNIYATDFYVATPEKGGNDNNPGTESAPFASLYKASLFATQPGDVIYIGEGTFAETNQIVLSKGVDIIGAGKDNTILKAAAYLDDALILLKYTEVPGEYGNQMLTDFSIDGEDKSLLKMGIACIGVHNVKFLRISFSGIIDQGIRLWSGIRGISASPPTLFIKGLEVAYCTFENCGSSYPTAKSFMIGWGHLDGPNIHHNSMNNMLDPDPGSAIVGEQMGYIKGGRFHHNDIQLNPDMSIGYYEPQGMELRHGIGENHIYYNKFNAWLSFVRSTNDEAWHGHPEGSLGDYTVVVHHNTIDLHPGCNKMAIELTNYSDVNIHDNYISANRGIVSHYAGQSGIYPDVAHPLWSGNILIHNNMFDIKNEGYYVINITPKNLNSSYKDVFIYNNTIKSKSEVFTLSGTYEKGQSTYNIHIKNNLVYDAPDVFNFFEPVGTDLITFDSIIVSHNYFYKYSNIIKNQQNQPIDEFIIYDTATNYLNKDPDLFEVGSKPLPFYKPSGISPILEAGIDLGYGKYIGAYGYIQPEDRTPPDAPQLIFPANNEIVNFISKPMFSWVAVVDDSSEIASYEIKINDMVYNTGTLTHFKPSVNLPNGSYNWHVRATDSKGNTSEWSNAYSFIIHANDTTKPSIPQPLDPVFSYSTADATPYFCWVKSTDNQGIQRYEIEFNNEIYRTRTDQSCFELPETIPSGDYQWRIRAVDLQGNKSEYSDYLPLNIETNSIAQTYYLTPEKDFYIRGGTYSDSAYGNLTPEILEIKDNIDDNPNTSYAYLVFNIAQLDAKIQDVNLLIHGKADRDWIGKEIEAHVLTNPDWNENKVNWNDLNPDFPNAPVATTIISDNRDATYSIPLTYTIEKFLSDGIKEICIVLEASIATQSAFVMHSKDNTTGYLPQLKILASGGSPDVAAPLSPSIIYPLNNGVSTPDVEYRWKPCTDISGIDYYEIIVDDSTYITIGDPISVFSLSRQLDYGVHKWQVRATDKQGNTGNFSKPAVFVVKEPVKEYYYFEAEDHVVNPWSIESSTSASGGEYIVVPEDVFDEGYNQIPAPDGFLNFTWEGEGKYYIWGRFQSPTTQDNAVWISVNETDTSRWGTTIDTKFIWDTYGRNPTKYLESGEHKLEMTYSENGTMVDIILITNDENFVPTEFGTVPINWIDLNKYRVYMLEDDTDTLTAQILPINAHVTNIIWQSSDSTIVSVKNGIITAKKTGSAVISIVSSDEKMKVECKIYVVDAIPVLDIEIDKYLFTDLTVGDNVTLSATVSPEDAYDKTIIWSTSDPGVATIDSISGDLKVVGYGITTITAWNKEKTVKDFYELIIQTTNTEKPIQQVSSSILVYPNPAREHISIQLPGVKQSGEHTVAIYNLDGRIVFFKKYNMKNLTNTIRIEENFKPGNYVLKVMNNNVIKSCNVVIY